MQGASDTQHVCSVPGRLSFACPARSCRRREAALPCSPQTFTLLPRVPGIPLNSAARARGLQYRPGLHSCQRVSQEATEFGHRGRAPENLQRSPASRGDALCPVAGHSSPRALLSYLRSCGQHRCEVPCIAERCYLEWTGLMSNELSFHSRLQTAAVSTQLSEQALGKQRGCLGSLGGRCSPASGSQVPLCIFGTSLEQSLV